MFAENRLIRLECYNRKSRSKTQKSLVLRGANSRVEPEWKRCLAHDGIARPGKKLMKSRRHNLFSTRTARITVAAGVCLIALATTSSVAQERSRFGIGRLFGAKKAEAKNVEKTNSLIERARELLAQSREEASQGRFEQALVTAQRAQKLVSVCEKTTPVRWPANEQSPAQWIARVEQSRRATRPRPQQIPKRPAPQAQIVQQIPVPLRRAEDANMDDGVLPIMPAPDPEFARPRRVEPLRSATNTVSNASPASGEFTEIETRQPAKSPADVASDTDAEVVNSDGTDGLDFSLPDTPAAVATANKNEVANNNPPTKEATAIQQASAIDQPNALDHAVAEQADGNSANIVQISNEANSADIISRPNQRPSMPEMPEAQRVSAEEPPGQFDSSDAGAWTQIPNRATAPGSASPAPRIEHAIVQEPAHEPQPFDATQQSESALPRPLVNSELEPTPLPIPDDLVGAAPRLHPLEPTPITPQVVPSQSHHEFLDLTRPSETRTTTKFPASNVRPFSRQPEKEAAGDSLWTSALIHVVSTLVGFVLALLFLFRYGSRLGLTLRVEHINGLPAQAGDALQQAGTATPAGAEAGQEYEAGVIPFEAPEPQSTKKTAGAIDPPFPFRIVSESTYEDERLAAEEAAREQEQAMIQHIFNQNLDLQRELKRG